MSTSITLPPDGVVPRRSAFVRNTWLIAGGMALTAMGVAAGLTWRPAATAPVAQTEITAPAAVDARASLSPNEAVVDPAKPAEKSGENSVVGNVAAQQRHAAAPHHATPAQSSTKVEPAQPSTTVASSGTTPLATQPAAVCSTCGVVEGVREVQQKGKGTGLGAVAGGVVGGAVGNQMGKGGGRTAMTILGAIGGGLAGNEVEKRARAETVYEVRVRMDDGSLRTLTQKSAPTPGSHVTIDGNTLHTTHAPSGEGQMTRTSSTGA